MGVTMRLDQLDWAYRSNHLRRAPLPYPAWGSVWENRDGSYDLYDFRNNGSYTNIDPLTAQAVLFELLKVS